MQLVALALFFTNYISSEYYKYAEIKLWVYVFIASVIPAFMIFTLWSKPNSWFYIIALSGTALHLISWFIIMRKIKNQLESTSLLMKTALLAISLKVMMQVMVCIPVIGEWTFFSRNLIIGYLHLITLGTLTPMILDLLIQKGLMQTTNQLQKSNVFYVFATFLYLLILFIQPFLLLFEISIPGIREILLLNAILLMLAGICYLLNQLNLFNRYI